jgi:hypothetical protein
VRMIFLQPRIKDRYFDTLSSVSFVPQIIHIVKIRECIFMLKSTKVTQSEVIFFFFILVRKCCVGSKDSNVSIFHYSQ